VKHMRLSCAEVLLTSDVCCGYMNWEAPKLSHSRVWAIKKDDDDLDRNRNSDSPAQ